MKEFELPTNWGLSEQQELVIGSLLDDAGRYLSAKALCDALYSGSMSKNQPAPAKLRVLIQRCREILHKLSKGVVTIDVRRNSGWKITVHNRGVLQIIVDEQSKTC